jgi:hypothetical protein
MVFLAVNAAFSPVFALRNERSSSRRQKMATQAPDAERRVKGAEH